MSARINELIDLKYLTRSDATRKCSVTGKTVHAVMLPPMQMTLELEAA